MSDLKSVSGGVQVQSATPADYIVPVPPTAGVIFNDNFATGDLSKTANGFSWQGSVSTSVTTDNPRSGVYSLRLFFAGTGTNYTNSIAEQRFSFPSQNEIYIKFFLYLPDGTEGFGGAAYRRTSTAESGFTSLNHKFIRIWDDFFGYSSNPEKMGASTWPSTALAKESAEYSETDGGPLLTHYDGDIFFSSDLGKWTEFIINAKIQTSASVANGRFRIWRNGALTVNETGITNYASDRLHIFNYGYLLGAANHGFTDDTIIFIDDFTISTESLL